MPYTWTHQPILSAAKKLELMLTLWRIEYKSDPGAGQEQLVRGPIGSQLTKVFARTNANAKAKGQGQGKTKKLAAAAAGQNEPQWRGCKHLFV